MPTEHTLVWHMTRDTQHVIKTGEQSADDPYTFIMSSERTDRMGDVIRQDGWVLNHFKRNPVALFGHQHSFPIGTWKNVRVEGKRLLGELQLAATGTSDRIDEIRSLIEQRILRAVSVGFRIKEYEPIDMNEPWGGWDIKVAELLETSVVSVPAHQDALMTAKSLGISKATQRIVFEAGQPTTPKSVSGKSATVTPTDYSDLLGASSDDLRALRSGKF